MHDNRKRFVRAAFSRFFLSFPLKWMICWFPTSSSFVMTLFSSLLIVRLGNISGSFKNYCSIWLFVLLTFAFQRCTYIHSVTSLISAKFSHLCVHIVQCNQSARKTSNLFLFLGACVHSFHVVLRCSYNYFKIPK